MAAGSGIGQAQRAREMPSSRRHSAHAVLTGLLYCSALSGVLAEIEALGLDLLEVRQLTADCGSPESGDSGSP